MQNAHVKAQTRIKRTLFFLNIGFPLLVFQLILETGSVMKVQSLGLDGFTFCNEFFFDNITNKFLWLFYEFSFYLVFVFYVLYILQPKNKSINTDSQKEHQFNRNSYVSSVGSSSSQHASAVSSLFNTEVENNNTNELLCQYIV